MKFCKDCKHFGDMAGTPPAFRCMNPDFVPTTKYELVFGNPIPDESQNMAFYARLEWCGAEAKYFEDKPDQNSQPPA